MTLSLPNDLANHTPADAAPVQQNYRVIEDYINTDVITRDGAVGMQAPLLLAAGGTTQPLHAATKAYVDAVLPVGIILPFGGNVAPAGSWALANGAPLLVSAYPTLFAVLGYRYGGNNTDTFWLPNLAGRVPIGIDPTQSRFDASGKAGGSFAVPVPEHSHPMPHSHTIAHYHDHPHQHAIDHDHPNVATTLGGTHVHDMEIRENTSISTVLRPAASSSSGTTKMISANVMRDNGAHQHNVDVPYYSGASGGASPSATGGSSAGDSGPSSAGNTSNVGTAAAELLPPYVVISYIVRIA